MTTEQLLRAAQALRTYCAEAFCEIEYDGYVSATVRVPLSDEAHRSLVSAGWQPPAHEYRPGEAVYTLSSNGDGWPLP